MFGLHTVQWRAGLRVAGVVVLGTLIACAASRNDGQRNDASRNDAGRRTMMHDGLQRAYVVRVPATRPASPARMPLVFVLHGGGGDAANAERMTGFTAKGAAEKFIVVYPEGTGRLFTRLLTWNAGHCCGYALENRVRDVEFIDALLDRMLAEYPVDPSRVYITGMSNGAMMSHRVGSELSSRFAAIAPVVGAIFGDERAPTHAVSAIMINGLLDKSVPVAGGVSGGRFGGSWDGTPARPSQDQASFWARANGCTAPEQRRVGTDDITRYRCPPGLAVELHVVRDNGHAWPGGVAGSRLGDAPSSSMNATDVIWAFFAEHPRVAPPRATPR